MGVPNAIGLMERNSRKRRNCREGSALLLTLLVIATLTGLTLAFSEETSVEMDLAGFARDSQRAHEMARSGVNLALAILHQDEAPGMDSLREDWARFGSEPFPDSLPEDLIFSGSIADESGKFNINALVNEDGEIHEVREKQLRRLFNALGLEEDLVDPILDWLDRDDIQRLVGAESDYYRGLEPAYGSANGPLLTLGQIFLVKGMAGIKGFGDQRRLTDYLTIYSDGKININTAPSEVLESLSPKLDSSMAEAIIQYRKDKDFLSAEELVLVPGMSQSVYNEFSPMLTVRSIAFSIEVEAKYRETLTKISAIAIRDQRRPKVVYWKVD